MATASARATRARRRSSERSGRQREGEGVGFAREARALALLRPACLRRLRLRSRLQEDGWAFVGRRCRGVASTRGEEESDVGFRFSFGAAAIAVRIDGRYRNDGRLRWG